MTCFPGGAVAVDVAARPEYASRIWCLILENTFTSIPDMAKVLIGWRVLQYLPLCLYKNKVRIVQMGYKHFGGAYCIHLWGIKVSGMRMKLGYVSRSWSLRSVGISDIFDHEDINFGNCLQDYMVSEHTGSQPK